MFDSILKPHKAARDMSHLATLTTHDEQHLTLLPDWGVMLATGDDAADFLHKQLSNDMLSLDDSSARLAAFCNVKGRVQASMVALRLDAQTIALLMPRNLLETTRKRLSMFVMRAKCSLTDASERYAVMGFVRPCLASPVQPAWQRITLQLPWGQADSLAWPAAQGAQAWLVLAPAAGAPTEVQEDALANWQFAFVASGVAMVSQPTYEAFVPQMLNYESVGGVSFKKGCYPGQEVVARSQFRGAIKRRAMLAQLPPDVALPVVGAEVFANRAEQPDSFEACGVVLGAASFEGQQVVSFSTQQAIAQEATALRLVDANGPVLQLLNLPYALLADI